MNKSKSPNKTSKFIGVSLYKDKWIAKITKDSKIIFRKIFNTEEEAALERDKFLINNSLHYYKLNFVIN
jgi:hypothetical protein